MEKIFQSGTEHIETENKNSDSKNGILDTIHDIADSLQQQFEELIGIESEKETFAKKCK